MSAIRLTFAGGLWRIEDGLDQVQSLAFRSEVIQAGPMCGEVLSVVQRWERCGKMLAIWSRWLRERGTWSQDYNTASAEIFRALWMQDLRLKYLERKSRKAA